MAGSSQIDDAIYTAAAVGLKGDSATRTALPSERNLSLQRSRLVRFLEEVDADLTVSDLLDELRDVDA